MDKELFYHTVATETAKAYVSNNMPLNINSGSANYAKDFAEKYIEAYEIAKNVGGAGAGGGGRAGASLIIFAASDKIACALCTEIPLSERTFITSII